MYGSGYVFSKPFFTGWVVVGILWLFFSAGCVGIYPLWEGRASMAHTFKGIWRDLAGRGGALGKGNTRVVEGVNEGSGSGEGSVDEKGIGAEEVVEKESM